MNPGKELTSPDFISRCTMFNFELLPLLTLACCHFGIWHSNDAVCCYTPEYLKGGRFSSAAMGGNVFTFVCLSVCKLHTKNSRTDLNEILAECHTCHKRQMIKIWEWFESPRNKWNVSKHLRHFFLVLLSVARGHGFICSSDNSEWLSVFLAWIPFVTISLAIISHPVSSLGHNLHLFCVWRQIRFTWSMVKSLKHGVI